MDHKNAVIHDGNRVRLELQSKEVTHSDFADGMEWDISKVSRMLNRESWKTDDLAQAGNLLNCDFFEAYQPSQAEGPNAEKPETMTVFLPLSVPVGREALDEAQRQLLALLDTIRPIPGE